MTDLREQDVSFSPRPKPLDGSTIKTIREAAGLSTVGVALDAGLQPSTLELIENEIWRRMDDEPARSLAGVLGVAPEQVFTSQGRAMEFVERNPGVLSSWQEARNQLQSEGITPAQQLTTIIDFLNGVVGNKQAMQDPLVADFAKQIIPKV